MLPAAVRVEPSADPEGRTDTGVVMLEPGATLAVEYTFSWSQ